MKYHCIANPAISGSLLFAPLMMATLLFAKYAVVPSLEMLALSEISDLIKIIGNILFVPLFIGFTILLFSVFKCLEAIIYKIPIEISTIKSKGTLVGIIFLLATGIIILFTQKTVGIHHVNFNTIINVQLLVPFPAVIFEIIITEIEKRKKKHNLDDIIDSRIEDMYN